MYKSCAHYTSANFQFKRTYIARLNFVKVITAHTTREKIKPFWLHTHTHTYTRVSYKDLGRIKRDECKITKSPSCISRLAFSFGQADCVAHGTAVAYTHHRCGTFSDVRVYNNMDNRKPHIIIYIHVLDLEVFFYFVHRIRRVWLLTQGKTFISLYSIYTANGPECVYI